MKTKLDAANLRGIFPAIPTPVNPDDTVAVGAVRSLMEHVLRGGVNGVVPVGGTGEYGALARKERANMVALCAQAANGRVPVIAGVLDPGFYDALDSGRSLAAAGADALLVVTPYYTTPTQRGIRDYFMRYADASPVPILVYEIPYRTRIAIDPEVMHELSQHANIIGMKACNTDMTHFLWVVSGVSDSFAVLSGEDTLFPLHVAAGACGGIVVTASLLPRAWLALHRLASSGQIAQAMAMHRELMPLLDMVFAETNPGPMKAVMDLIGVHAPRVLAPLVTASAGLESRLRRELQQRLDQEATFG